MDIRTNETIDVVDRLTRSASADQLWQTVCDIGSNWGASAINMAGVAAGTGQIGWARSSMSESWLNEYIGEGYYLCDPLLDLFQGDRTNMLIDCGGLRNGEEHTAQEVRLNHGLRDAGYSTMHGFKLLAPEAASGTIVTFCFDQLRPMEVERLRSKLASAAAVFASFVKPAFSEEDSGYLEAPGTLLTSREREVLSLLAAGYQTARIAERLGLAQVTVGKHFASAKSKLGAQTREQALFEAMRRGLIAL